MRWKNSLGMILLILSGACATSTIANQAAPAETSDNCRPQAAGALVVHPLETETKPSNHTTLAPTLKFVSTREVEGRCISQIVLYSFGEVFLSSTERLVIEEDGNVKYAPPYPLPEKGELSFDKVDGLPGYRLIMSEKILTRSGPLGEQTHIGLFRGPSDDVVARFDVLNGRSPRNAEPLLRSGSQIISIDFLPAPDTSEGWIGLVERSGTNKASLYTYKWTHGQARTLSF